jgi:hypothetical protein
MQFFSTPINSPLLITLTVSYGICAAITTFNARIIQAKQVGYLTRKKAYVPAWTGLFAILLWVTWTAIFLLNWRYALAVFVIKLALKNLYALENIGAWLFWPILDKETASAVNIAVIAADEIKAMNHEWKKEIKAINRR